MCLGTRPHGPYPPSRKDLILTTLSLSRLTYTSHCLYFLSATEDPNIELTVRDPVSSSPDPSLSLLLETVPTQLLFPKYQVNPFQQVSVNRYFRGIDTIEPHYDFSRHKEDVGPSSFLVPRTPTHRVTTRPLQGAGRETPLFRDYTCITNG